MVGDYERRIFSIMRDRGFTLSEAIHEDLCDFEIDISSVFDIVDYMEEQLGDLDKVQLLMSIYVGDEPDYIISDFNEKKKED